MAGTVTVSHFTQGFIRKIQIDWVGDASDGSVPATALPAFEGRLLALVTNPGSPAPTANYDITLVDAEGADRLQGVGMNRHTTSTEQVPIVYSSSTVPPAVDESDVLTFTLANNSVNSAAGRAILIYALAA